MRLGGQNRKTTVPSNSASKCLKILCSRSNNVGSRLLQVLTLTTSFNQMGRVNLRSIKRNYEMDQIWSVFRETTLNYRRNYDSEAFSCKCLLWPYYWWFRFQVIFKVRKVLRPNAQTDVIKLDYLRAQVSGRSLTYMFKWVGTISELRSSPLN